jgi:hypothetical protein
VQSTECRDRGDVPCGVLENDGLVGEVVQVRVDAGHFGVWIWRWRRRAHVAVVVVRFIFHAPCGGGGRSRRVC